MELPLLSEAPFPLLGSFPEEITEWLKSFDSRSYVGKQLLEWVYEKQVDTLEAMTNLPKALRTQLEGRLQIKALTLQAQEEAQDGQTVKFLWKLHDGKAVESVLIFAPDRQTVCVSSQVGCPARCAFCASGKNGFVRQLTAQEIVEQVWAINRLLEEPVTNIVFMGMGEPLENYENVTRALALLTHPRLMGFSKRRITLSTVGIEDKIYRLADEGYGVSLAFSLHAPTQKLREKIIPYARKYSLESLLKALRYYESVTKREITFEYTLIAEWNDEPEHAEELAQLLEGWRCTVNLIPYNPVEGLLLNTPSTKRIEAFRHILSQAGIRHTCRYTKGRDIAAACGQLALNTLSLNSAAQ